MAANVVPPLASIQRLSDASNETAFSIALESAVDQRTGTDNCFVS